LALATFFFTGTDSGVHTFTQGATLVTAADQTITVADTLTSSISGTSEAILVTPGDATQFRIEPSTRTPTAGVPFSVTVTVQDAYHNPVTAYTGAVYLSSTDPQASRLESHPFAAADNGVFIFSGPNMVLKTAGALTVLVSDGILSSTAVVTVNPGAATRFRVAPSTRTPMAGVAFPTTVTAQDPFNNTVTSYTGVVFLTSTDPLASSCGSQLFTAIDRGVSLFGVVQKTAGVQTLTASDGALRGSASLTVAPSTEVAIQVASYAIETISPSNPVVTLSLTPEPAPGQTTEKWGELTVSRTGGDTAPVPVLFGLYASNPTPLPPPAPVWTPVLYTADYIDIQISNTNFTGEVTLQYRTQSGTRPSSVSYFNSDTNRWVALPQESWSFDPGTGVVTVVITDTSILMHTVFAIAVPVAGSQAATIYPPTVRASSASSATMSDVGASSGQSVTFISRSQVTATIAPTQERLLSTGGYSQGVETGSSEDLAEAELEKWWEGFAEALRQLPPGTHPDEAPPLVLPAANPGTPPGKPNSSIPIPPAPEPSPVPPQDEDEEEVFVPPEEAFFPEYALVVGHDSKRAIAPVAVDQVFAGFGELSALALLWQGLACPETWMQPGDNSPRRQRGKPVPR
jgi:hypothetical protein